MALVDSLLTAMVRANGDALVMHVGERPIVVAGPRTIDLSHHGMTLGAMVGMLGQLLPGEAQGALSEFGAVEHELAARDGERFSVVAARGGDDIWIEIRRRRPRRAESNGAASAGPRPDAVAPAANQPALSTPRTEPIAETGASPAPAGTATAPPAVEPPADVVHPAGEPAEAAPTAVTPSEKPAILAPSPSGPPTDVDAGGVAPETAPPADLEPALPAHEPIPAVASADSPAPAPPAAADPGLGATVPGAGSGGARPGDEAAAPEEPWDDMAAAAAASPGAVEPVEQAAPADTTEVSGAPDTPEVRVDAVAEAGGTSTADAAAADADAGEQPVPVLVSAVASPSEGDRPVLQVPPMDTMPTAGLPAGGAAPPPPPPPESPVPSTPFLAEPRSPEVPVLRTVRIEVPDRSGAVRPMPVSRLLQAAADQGASDLLLLSRARPMVRVDGSLRVLDHEPAAAAADIDAVLGELTPEPWREAVGRGDPAEWLIEVPAVGRLRCTAFRDQRGPGVSFHFLALHPTSMERLGLDGDARLLASEPDGLVVLAGPGVHERTTLAAAFVDGINRQRSDYVIALAPQVRVLHEPRVALLSQREVGTAGERVAAAVRAALREDPDVLVVEELDAPEAAALAVDAAGSGRLVVVSLAEASAQAAVRRLIELLPADRRPAALPALSRSLRGALAQVQFRRAAGGRVSAREAWLMTAAVARQLAAGDATAVDLAPPAGVSLFDTLVQYVRDGAVDVREALRRAPDPVRLREALRSAGVDTSAVDRLA